MGRLGAYRGPIAIVVVVVVAVVAFVLVGGGGDDDDSGDTASGGQDSSSGGGEADAEFPGIGTEEALANPQCDAESGLVKIPTFRRPQCVKEWPEGEDNGGATSPGVTGESIKVVVRIPSTTEPEAEEVIRQEGQNAFDMVADHLETWGRDWELVFHKASGEDEAAQRADATEIANDIQPFAAVSNSSTGAFPVWEAELAARGVVVFGWVQSWEDQQAQPGYRWSFFLDDRLRLTHTAEYIGKRLAGSPARWAGDEALQDQERKFAVVYSEESTMDIDYLRERLAEHDVEPLVIAHPMGEAEQASHARTAVARMKEEGVTTVVSLFEFGYGAALTEQAQADGFSPEWFVTGHGASDTNVLSRTLNQEQWRHAFGIGGINLQVRGEVNYNNRLYQWHYGRQPGPEASAALGQLWTPAQFLTNGVHLAGPNLTPETLQEALFGMEPFGGSWDDSRVEIGFSFGDDIGVDWDDYSGQDDMAEKWWDPDTVGVDEVGAEDAGMWWQLDNGRRYRVGEWPEGEPEMFSTEGATTFLESYPEGDAPPDYEHVPKSPS